ncbi:hypothetical protein VNO80_26629 [Phaseolus coccineus]|uniref:Uncharacterized protein n=1 Tax=Phaseolus coccineus TaxID=3886 RepID=A0AAN9QKN8_PHACN
MLVNRRGSPKSIFFILIKVHTLYPLERLWGQKGVGSQKSSERKNLVNPVIVNKGFVLALCIGQAAEN